MYGIDIDCKRTQNQNVESNLFLKILTQSSKVITRTSNSAQVSFLVTIKSILYYL